MSQLAVSMALDVPRWTHVGRIRWLTRRRWYLLPWDQCRSRIYNTSMDTMDVSWRITGISRSLHLQKDKNQKPSKTRTLDTNITCATWHNLDTASASAKKLGFGHTSSGCNQSCCLASWHFSPLRPQKTAKCLRSQQPRLATQISK